MISEKNFDISLNPTNLFTSDVPVKGKAYCRLFIDVVGEGSWEIISDSTYDIINDVIVFPVQPSGKYLSLQVSTTPAELTQSPTENSMILTIKNEIKEVANNMENVILLNNTLDVIVPNITKVGVVADNILDVNKVATDITKVGVVATDITKVGVVATDITKVGVVADNILNVNAIGVNISKVVNVDDNIAKISNVDANIAKISNLDANMTKISNVDANMTDINNAEENAQLALQYKNLAEKWSSELEDVVVADGKFSAYHWALKAYQLVTEGVINDISSSTITTYSSDKLDALLTLKANLLNPIFSKSASIGGATLSSWGNTYSVIEGISGSFFGNDGIDTIIGNNAYYDGTNWRYKANGRATLQRLSGEQHTFYTTISGSTGDVITWNVVAQLHNDGVIIPSIQSDINSKLNADFSLFTDKAEPVNTDIFPIRESGGLLKKLSWSNIKATLKTYFDTLYSKLTPTIASGSISFNGTTNNINYVGIGLNVEVGDVIGVAGSTNNNDLYTVEVITNADNIIVNQAHAGKPLTYTNGKRTKTLNTEISNATIKLISKYYNAENGLGQDWVNVTTSRVAGTTYPNNTNRTISVSITGTGNPSSNLELLINGDIVQKNHCYEAGTTSNALVGNKIPKLSSYRVNAVAGSIIYFYELR